MASLEALESLFQGYDAYRHIGGCNQVAFWYRDGQASRGQVLRASSALSVTGERIEPMTECVCGSCGKPVTQWSQRGFESEQHGEG